MLGQSNRMHEYLLDLTLARTLSWLNSIVSSLIITWIIFALENNNTQQFRKFLITLIIIKVLIKWIRVWINYYNLFVNNRITDTVQKHYLKKYINLDNNRLEMVWTGRAQSIIANWVSKRAKALAQRAEIIAKSINILIAWIIVTTQVNWRQFLILFWLFILAVYLIATGFNVLMETRRQSKKHTIAIDRQNVKIFMNKFEILLNNKISNETNTISVLHKEDRKTRTTGITKKLPREIGGESSTDLTLIIVIIALWYMVFDGTYSIAWLVLLTSMVGKIWWLISEIRRMIKEYHKTIVDVEKLIEFFETIPEGNYNAWKNFIYKQGNISLNNISFSYITHHFWSDKHDTSKDIFSQFSLDIQWWKKTALVWHSWSGKSTLIKLIAWYITPSSWSISIDKQDLKKTNILSYYRHIWYLTQEPSIFDGTIKENLLYGIMTSPHPLLPGEGTSWKQPLSSKEKDKRWDTISLEEAIKLSHCDFVHEFPDGLDTEIGERWIRLSGWQRQRLAIAKIFLKNPEIILLDEPTSALDSFSEEKITDAMHKLFEWRTVIVIAHRLQTVKEADDIIYLHNGQIIERGTHQELIKQKGEYANMLKLQTGF